MNQRTKILLGSCQQSHFENDFRVKSRDNKKRILAQAETLSISDSSLLNYQIQRLLFYNSPVNQSRGSFLPSKNSFLQLKNSFKKGRIAIKREVALKKKISEIKIFFPSKNFSNNESKEINYSSSKKDFLLSISFTNISSTLKVIDLMDPTKA